jgi:hypothetical protein
MYNLVIYVEIPEASGVDLSYLSSPLATISCYEGFNSDIDAPEWTRMEVNQPLQFRQPCGAMAEVFMKLAFWAENAEIVSAFTWPRSTQLIAHVTQPSLSKVMLEWAMANAASFYQLYCNMSPSNGLGTGRYPCTITNQNANYP